MNFVGQLMRTRRRRGAAVQAGRALWLSGPLHKHFTVILHRQTTDRQTAGQTTSVPCVAYWMGGELRNIELWI